MALPIKPDRHAAFDAVGFQMFTRIEQGQCALTGKIPRAMTKPGRCA
jgi:hypothetical protein